MGDPQISGTGRIDFSLGYAILYTIAEVHIRAEAGGVRLSINERTAELWTRSEEAVDTQLVS